MGYLHLSERVISDHDQSKHFMVNDLLLLCHDANGSHLCCNSLWLQHMNWLAD